MKTLRKIKAGTGGVALLALLVLAGCFQNDPSSSDDKEKRQARIRQQHETCAEVLSLSVNPMGCDLEVPMGIAARELVHIAVCGKDGETYESLCAAKKAGIEVAYDGFCIAQPDTCGKGKGIILPGDDCVCTMEYAPVCGKNGVTYGNRCGASCAKVEVDHEGECEEGPGLRPIGPIEPIIPGDPKCDPIDPVDPIVTPVDPIKPIIPGDPDPGRVCIALWDPVCGVNGATYGNECEAGDVKIAHKGACEGPHTP